MENHVNSLTAEAVDKVYPSAPSVPDLYVRVVATGNATMPPVSDPFNAPQWLRNDLVHWTSNEPQSVLVLDLGEVRWETETLIRTLTSALSAVQGALDGDVVLVVATTQPGVAELARMIATHVDVPLYVAHSPMPADIAAAIPAGKLTATERETLTALNALGGRVTVSGFAAAASIEVTAAGNRLGNLAKRGYINRVARSRRAGDEFVSPAWFDLKHKTP